MKRIFLTLAVINGISITQLFAGLPGLALNNNGPWLKSGTVSPAHKKLINTVKSYPSMGTYLNEDGVTHTAHQFINNRCLNGSLPPEIIPTIKSGGFSILRGQKTDFNNYPKGATLFPDYPDLATKFDALITLMVTKPVFKAFFNKIHLNILNELYENFMNIYTNFNLQHVGIKETNNSQGSTTLSFNIPLFLQNETDYEANKKTLIINHLVNIIESQMNGKIKSIMPSIPHLFATSAGKALIQNDYSIDITALMIKQIDPGMAKYKQLYIEGLATYLSFFQEFTSLLLQPHPKKPNHFTAFVHVAEAINEFLYGSKTANDTNSDPEKQVTQALSKMNPPLFTFNYDDIRALKLLPHLAKSLNPKSKSIDWPSHIVTAAEQGTMVSGHPIAYFKDNSENIVKKEQAEHLYVVLQSGANYFQEELLEQPDWLNNEAGVINIMRGCFGDFSALIGLKVIDPCTETLIKSAMSVASGTPYSDNDSLALICQTFLDDVTYLKSGNTTLPKTTPANEQNQQQPNINNIVQNQVIPNQQQPPDQTNLAPSANSIPDPNNSSANNIIPSNQNINPSSNVLTPSDQDLSPSSSDLTPQDQNLSPSSSDISDILNQ